MALVSLPFQFSSYDDAHPYPEACFVCRVGCTSARGLMVAAFLLFFAFRCLRSCALKRGSRALLVQTTLRLFSCCASALLALLRVGRRRPVDAGVALSFMMTSRQSRRRRKAHCTLVPNSFGCQLLLFGFVCGRDVHIPPLALPSCRCRCVAWFALLRSWTSTFGVVHGIQR